MPMISERLGMAFFPIPKNAGTSVRYAMFELENGRGFKPESLPDGRLSALFMTCPALPFEQIAQGPVAGLTRFAVVRDPLERVVSAYKNRVLFYRELETADYTRYNLPDWLPRSPDINTFISLLDYYRKMPVMAHHTRHQRVYLGPDLAFFDRLFQMHELPELADFLSERSGRPVALGKLRNDGPQVPLDTVSDESRRRLRRYYDIDYALLGDRYCRH
ncbi:Sulfotransferase family protein [Faunimonas pinastri]|uniref:Sulfotransferase family protein n=1 Tax=Faunimonas pinastri TaxID=1855383 RepID=A0A1H9CMS8_9HYPH|nr:sulfotransferase family 2 domain-containing protein [Faunimonas pinastri]SEQ02357.1 Sulfotransferase family protein [Faunimonas pinastri]